MTVRHTIIEMQNIAKKRGGICLSKEYKNVISKLKWRCKEGHEWEAIPASIKRGSWCPYCARNVKLTIEEMRMIARGRGGECLSKKYIDSNTKLRWRCKEGHEWKATPRDIKNQGSWCPTCSGSKKLTIEDMRQTAKNRGGECLSKKYLGGQTKLRWKCKEGHEWEAHPNIVRMGRWCPYCAGKTKLTLQEMQRIAEERGGKCLSKRYINYKTKLKWQCKEGHEWKATPTAIKYTKTWCPVCANKMKSYKMGLTIEEMKQIAEKRGGKCLSKEYISSGTKLKWRCNKGHEWYATPDSIKRGTWCPYCHAKAKLTMEDMRRMAKERNGKCLSKEYVNSRTKLRWRCKEGHEWDAQPNSIRLGQWCPYCARVAKLTIEEMQKLAASRGGKCLSKRYINSKTKLKWRCREGHTWETTPQQIKRGQWCPNCSGIAKLTIEEMQRIAKEKGGRCLSKKYINNNTKLSWRCKKGHEWEATPSSIKHGKNWCPVCGKKTVADKLKLTIEEMQRIAKKRGGKCLSTKYIHSGTKLKWQCKKGHKWEATPGSIKNGKTWCPVCAGRRLAY